MVLEISMTRLTKHVFKLPGFPAKKIGHVWCIDKRQFADWLRTPDAMMWLERRGKLGYNRDFHLEDIV